MRYELTDYEWAAIKPFLPNKPRGVPVLMTGACSTASFGSCARARRGAICRSNFGPYTTCYNRFVRWREVVPVV